MKKETIEIPLHYHLQDDGTKVYDWELMQEVFNNKLTELQNKEGN
tara:strand:+ start:353 stop:487 length:135 start_codon:yes stop_codon:yes gene_type:complete